MTDADIKTETSDSLADLRMRIVAELARRTKEPTQRCWVVRLSGCESGATFFKKYEEAKTEFIDEVDFTVRDTGNKYSLEPLEIPTSDYNSRPDRWYS
jgi:hypothetical protein